MGVYGLKHTTISKSKNVYKRKEPVQVDRAKAKRESERERDE